MNRENKEYSEFVVQGLIDIYTSSLCDFVESIEGLALLSMDARRDRVKEMVELWFEDVEENMAGCLEPEDLSQFRKLRYRIGRKLDLEIDEKEEVKV